MTYKFTEECDYWSQPFRQNAEKNLQDYKDRPCRYLEIGVFEGQSLVWMATSILTHAESFGIGVDPWDGDEAKYKQALHNVQLHQDRIGVIRGVLAGCCTTFRPESFDVVYIDGDHTYLSVLTDTCLAWPLLKVGGIMIWDDTEWSEPEYQVRRAIHSVLPHLSCERLPAKDQVWVKKTRSI